MSTTLDLAQLPWHDSSVDGLRYDEASHTLTLAITLGELPEAAEDEAEQAGELVFRAVSALSADPALPSFDPGPALDGEILELDWTDAHSAKLVIQLFDNIEHQSSVAVINLTFASAKWNAGHAAD